MMMMIMRLTITVVMMMMMVVMMIMNEFSVDYEYQVNRNTRVLPLFSKSLSRLVSRTGPVTDEWANKQLNLSEQSLLQS